MVPGLSFGLDLCRLALGPPGQPVAAVRCRRLHPPPLTRRMKMPARGNFAAPDRNVLQALNRAQKVLKEHRYGEALEGLTQILRSSEDYFYQPDRKVPIYKSLKAEAQQLLGQMPRRRPGSYEVRSGAEARDKLNRAVATGDARDCRKSPPSCSIRRRATKPPTCSPCIIWITAHRWPGR